MRGKSLLCAVSMLALCTGLVMADNVEIMIYDHTGSLVTDQFVAVTSPSGQTVAKLAPVSDGVYALDPALAGQKVVFRVLDPALGFFDTMDARIPEWVQEPVIITLPTPPAQPLQLPNDTCDTAIPIALPSITPGSTVGAATEAELECEIPNTAGGVWYSVVGTGGPITLTTCELDATQPGTADYDSKISVYCLGCGAGNQCVAGNDDTAGGDFCGFTFHSTLTFASEAGVDYGILMHGFSTAQGTFEMSAYEGGVPTSEPVSCLPPPTTGACCVQECNDPVFGFCTVTTVDDCTALGGAYQGDDVGCAIPNGSVLSLTNPTPVPIPDGTSEFVCSTIDVINPADCDTVVDLDVGVVITHTWIGDLNVEITGPNGANSNMWQNRCGSTVNMDFFYDDEGTDNLCTVVAAPGVGRGQPTLAGLGPAFSQYDGLSPDGTWELCVNDTFPADSGQLEAWTLEIDCGASTCVFGNGGGDDDCTASGKVLVCHYPSGNPGNHHEICISESAVPAHLANHGGDTVGPCPEGASSSVEVLGIEAFGDSSNGDAVNPVINTRSGGDRPSSDRRGPRVPAGTRLPR